MSYKVLLKLLTKTFLLDDDLPEFTANKSLQTAIESHRSSFTSPQKSLQEAKLEVIPSPSVYSEIDVVLDDGTLQKRTVSLSTLPEDDELIHPDDPTAVDDERYG